MAKKKQKKGDQNANMDEATTSNIAEATDIRISQQLQKFLESNEEGTRNALNIMAYFLLFVWLRNKRTYCAHRWLCVFGSGLSVFDGGSGFEFLVNKI